MSRLLEEGNAYDVSRSRLRFPGMTINFVGSNSPAALASKAIRVLVMDEINKWPDWSGREADPVELARERTRTFWNRKICKFSTPTTESGYITRELKESTDERYHVPCPYCGHFQELVFGGAGKGPGIKWPEGATAEQLRKDQSAWYECVGCSGEIRDTHKSAMLKAGLWVPRGGKVIGGRVEAPDHPRKHVGYHLWAGYSPWLSFSDIAARFLLAKDSPAKLMNFHNSWLGKPWAMVVNELRAALVRQREGGYEEGKAPEGAWLLTAGVDVQSHQNRTWLYYVIRAWGTEGESWLVKYGFVEGWEILTQVLFKARYRDPTGAALPLHMVLIDSGDGNRTDEVYDYCLATGCWAYKGASRPKRPIQLSTVERLGTTLNLALVDSGFFKTRLHRLIHGKQWHLPTGMSEEYYSHMAAEQYVRTRDKKTGRDVLRWVVIPEGTANHLFDAEMMCLAAAEILEISNLTSPVKAEGDGEKTESGSEQKLKGWQPMEERVQVFVDSLFGENEHGTFFS